MQTSSSNDQQQQEMTVVVNNNNNTTTTNNVSSTTNNAHKNNSNAYTYNRLTLLFDDPELEREYVLFAFPGRTVISIILCSVSALFIFVPSFYALPTWALALDIVGCICAFFSGFAHFYHVYNSEREIRSSTDEHHHAALLKENEKKKNDSDDDDDNNALDQNLYPINRTLYTSGISRYLVSKVEEYSIVAVFTFAMLLQSIIMYVKYEGCVSENIISNPTSVPSCSNYVDHYLIIVIESFAVIAPARAAFVIPLTLLALLVLGLSYFWGGSDIVSGEDHGIRVGVEIIMAAICLTACVIREWAMRSLFVLHARAEKDREAAARLQEASNILLDSTLPKEITAKISHNNNNSPTKNHNNNNQQHQTTLSIHQRNFSSQSNDLIAAQQRVDTHNNPSMWDIDRANASVFQSDIAGFTKWCATLDPKAVVSTLASLISSLDDLTISVGVTKIKTIGDAFVAVAGLPSYCSKPAAVMSIFALRAQKVFLAHQHEREEACRRNPAGSVPPFKGFRIGIASGRVTGALVGSQIVSYEIIGSVNNLAQKMESSAPMNEILVCDKTKTGCEQDYKGVLLFEQQNDVVVPTARTATKSKTTAEKKKKAYVLKFHRGLTNIEQDTAIIVSVIKQNDASLTPEQLLLQQREQQQQQSAATANISRRSASSRSPHQSGGRVGVQQHQNDSANNTTPNNNTGDDDDDEDQRREDQVILNSASTLGDGGGASSLPGLVVDATGMSPTSNTNASSANPSPTGNQFPYSAARQESNDVFVASIGSGGVLTKLPNALTPRAETAAGGGSSRNNSLKQSSFVSNPSNKDPNEHNSGSGPAEIYPNRQYSDQIELGREHGSQGGSSVESGSQRSYTNINNLSSGYLPENRPTAASISGGVLSIDGAAHNRHNQQFLNRRLTLQNLLANERLEQGKIKRKENHKKIVEQDIQAVDLLSSTSHQQQNAAAPTTTRLGGNTTAYTTTTTETNNNDEEEEGDYEEVAFKLEDQLSDLAHEFNPDTLRKALIPRFVSESYEEEFTRYGRRVELLPFKVIGIQIAALIALLFGVQYGVYGRGSDTAIGILSTALVLSLVFVVAMVFFGDSDSGFDNEASATITGAPDAEVKIVTNTTDKHHAKEDPLENFDVEHEARKLRRNSFGSVTRTTVLLTIHYMAAALTIVGTSLWGDNYLSRNVMYLRFVCAVIKGSITSIPSWWGVIHDLVFPCGAAAFAIGYRTPANSVEEARRVEEIIFLVASLYVGWLCRLSNELSNKTNFTSMRRNELSSKLLRARRESALEVVRMAIPSRFCADILRKNVAFRENLRNAIEERRRKLELAAAERAAKEQENPDLARQERKARRRNQQQQSNSNNNRASDVLSNNTKSETASSNSSGALATVKTGLSHEAGEEILRFSVVNEFKNASIAFIDLTAAVADDVFLLQFILQKIEGLLDKQQKEKKNSKNSSSTAGSFVTKIKVIGSILMCAALDEAEIDFNQNKITSTSASSAPPASTELALYNFVVDALTYIQHSLKQAHPELYLGVSGSQALLKSHSSARQSQVSVDPEDEASSDGAVPPPKLAREDTATFTSINRNNNNVNKGTLPPMDSSDVGAEAALSMTNSSQRDTDNNNNNNNLLKPTTSGSASAATQQQEQEGGRHRSSSSFRFPSLDETLRATEIRVGLHSGNLIGCVLGQQRLSFDVLGDVVNQASRCMSTSAFGETAMTLSFYKKLRAASNESHQQNKTAFSPSALQAHYLLQQENAFTMTKRDMKGKGSVDVAVLNNGYI